MTRQEAESFAYARFAALAKAFGPSGVPPMDACLQVFEAWWAMYADQLSGETELQNRVSITAFVTGLFAGWDLGTQLRETN